jgi:hypothetical protein
LTKRKPPAKESALEALTDVLRPIAAAMLKGNLSASALVRSAKQAYLQAAIDSLNSEGKKKANISRLSVITGMTRKEISSYLPRGAPATTPPGPKKQMEHRALRVLRAWTTDPRYKMSSGRALPLPIEGEGKTFASLVRSYGGDVTTAAVLRELERLEAVTRSGAGLLRVKPGCIQVQLQGFARFRDFSRLLADFSGTAAQVLTEREKSLYFGFKDLEISSESQAARFKSAFGKRAALLLEGVEHWRSRERGNASAPRKTSRRVGHRVGVGVYLVEGPMCPSLRNR